MSEEKEAAEHPTATETATVTAETSQTQTQTEHASESPEEGTKKDSPYSLEDLLTFDAGEFEELNHIEDINEYSKSLHAEIEQLEREIAEEITKKVMDFVKLHKIVIESAQMLRMIKDTLNKYEESLRETTANIEELRSKSGYISTHLSNRITAKEKLDESLRSIIITPRLVETITKGPINVSYCQSIEELSRLLSPPKVVETSVAFKDACTVTALLCSIATMRIRDFLIQQFQNLAKPGANFQIYQQSILDKFRNLNHFLIEHAPHFEGEIRDAYLETLGPVIYSYFVIYFGKTATLYFKVGDNEDLLGMAPETKRRLFFFGEVSSKPKCSAFSLKLPGEAANVLRTDVLDQLNSPSIIPHVAIQSGKQFPYEQIYRSNLHILIDTISAEYLFSTRWFRAGLLRKKSTWNEIKSALFKGTFDRSLQLFKDNVSTFLASCHDILGTLLMARITEHHRMVAERRGLKIPELDAFFGELNDMIWSKAFEIIDLNIKNLKSFRPASSSYEFRPHFITRQYAEMISSVSAIGISGSMAQKLFQNLKLLRLQVEDVLLRLSAPLGGAVVRSVFLINNYDVVLTVVKQENRLSDEKSLLNDEITWFTRLLGTHTTVFIENELTTNFPEIVKFSRTPQQQQLLPATLDETIKSFNEHWKAGFQSISADVSKYFPNFDLGSDILRQTFGQFIVHYTTLENVVRSLQRTKEARSFIPLSTITYEIRNVKF